MFAISRSPDWEEQLKFQLEIEANTYGRGYFVALSGPETLDSATVSSLRQALPLVGIFVAGGGDREVLVKAISEAHLETAIRAFLHMLEDFRKKLP